MGEDKRQKQRVPLGVQLVIGEDDDLIAWLRGLVEGTRQPTIKTLLRKALKMKERPGPVADAAVRTRFEALEADNRRLRDAINELSQVVNQQPVAAVAPSDNGRVRQLEAENARLLAENQQLRDLNAQWAAWAGSIQQQAQPVAPVATADQTPPTDDDGRRISDEKLRRRAARLDKAEW